MFEKGPSYFLKAHKVSFEAVTNLEAFAGSSFHYCTPCPDEERRWKAATSNHLVDDHYAYLVLQIAHLAPS